ncbi:MAG: hypothetical protein NTV94_15265 [Planctomycetota bacterium]|nr:hypothetical protein [Planctomycetota bacterium]
MTFLSTLSAIAGMGAGILSHLLLAVLLIAGSANSSPAQAQRIRFQLVFLASSAAIGVIGGFIAMAHEMPWHACAVGGCVVVVVAGMFSVILWVTQA